MAGHRGNGAQDNAVRTIGSAHLVGTCSAFGAMRSSHRRESAHLGAIMCSMSMHSQGVLNQDCSV